MTKHDPRVDAYIDTWFEEAKTEATRQKRIAQATAWIAEGKTRNWKYMNC